MTTPQIDGTVLTIATLNDDWASAGSNLSMVVDVTSVTPLAAPPVEPCDVVFVQEGKRADYRTAAPASYDVQQDTSSKALAGSVLISRRGGSLSLTASGWTFLVRAVGLLGRYLVWGRFTVSSGAARDRRLFLGSAHRPPKRTARWWRPFDASLALRCRGAKRAGRLVIIGMDANQVHPEKLAKMCGLVWHSIAGRSIDGFLASPQIQFVEIRELLKGTSDHHPLVATVVVPKRKPKKRPVRVTYPAIAAAREQSHNGPAFGTGLCLQRVRICYGIGASAADAIGAWNAAKAKHPETDPTRIPRDYPVFWRGGSSGHGHIAISTGDGKCWSTDIRRPGFFDYVPIAEIHEKWGLTLLGWTGDLNGAPVIPAVES